MREGYVEVFTGPMCSGKSNAVVDKIKRFEIAGKKVVVIKPILDTRDEDQIKSRTGVEYTPSKCFRIEDLGEILPIVKEESMDLLVIEEFHFLDAKNYDSFLGSLLIELTTKGVSVVISGLDLSHNGRPFGLMGTAMCFANKIHKFTAICNYEKEDTATMTAMLMKSDDDKVAGGDDIYKPVTRTEWAKIYGV